MTQYSSLELKEASSQDSDLLLELMSGFNQEENINLFTSVLALSATCIVLFTNIYDGK
ncbi:hypothetical protein [Nostoc sp. FACHB-888]|uniref:hypothetical protein n=1 Tax=Nostoc sp. FACHB-888 TaxID=2692842 RepID=UPI001683773F|nr:hypothetical protein [Nostoc sp. FACHB-888]MBD2245978.1 hypothetical protein [Nostoc sp. FACHB-888]